MRTASPGNRSSNRAGRPSSSRRSRSHASGRAPSSSSGSSSTRALASRASGQCERRFLGASDPYAALKTTLKAEIDADAWTTLHGDTSRPFAKPSSGRIAVKVINHLGDEVMKVSCVE
jgi:hypothetical protein